MKDNESPNHGKTIKEMATELRPREKALANGIKSLTNAELMALIFATGIKGRSVIELSQDILDEFDGHLSKVTSLGVNELTERFSGIGPAKALNLLAALELGSRSAADARLVTDAVINSSEIAYDIMRQHLERLPYEEFWVLYLSQAGKQVRREKIGQGGLTATAVDVRIIMKYALEASASAMILFHNHPSGTLRPSPQDIALTRKIKDASALFEIRVNDHIIITDSDYYSMHDEGQLP